MFENKRRTSLVLFPYNKGHEWCKIIEVPSEDGILIFILWTSYKYLIYHFHIFLSLNCIFFSYLFQLICYRINIKKRCIFSTSLWFSWSGKLKANVYLIFVVFFNLSRFQNTLWTRHTYMLELSESFFLYTQYALKLRFFFI